jgi:type IV pilus assembly protein PilQ
MTNKELTTIWTLIIGFLMTAWTVNAQTDQATIQRGDIIYVEVYRVGEMTKSVQVDHEGNVTMPYIGAVNVVGLNESGAAAKLSGSMKKILRNPKVTVRKSMSSPSSSFLSIGTSPDMRIAVVPLMNADAESIYNTIRGTGTTGGNVNFDPHTNSIVITDTVEGIKNMTEVIGQLDSMRSQLTQVRIEAKIAEVRAGAFKEMGIRWFVQGDEFGMGFIPPPRQTVGINNLGGNRSPLANETVGSGSGTGGGSSGGSNREFVGDGFDRRLALPVNVPALGQTFLGYANSGIDVGMMLDMLVSDQKADLLANPMTITVNHQNALIKMVDQIPYTEYSTEITGATTFSTRFLDAGIILDVTPHVLQDEHGAYVKLELNPEVSFPIGSNNGVPILSIRQTSTVANVRNGQTLVVGGILNEDNHDVETKLPGIGNLPIIGRLFKHKEKTKDRRELMIFVTPTIYQNPEDITWDKMIDVAQEDVVNENEVVELEPIADQE